MSMYDYDENFSDFATRCAKNWLDERADELNPEYEKAVLEWKDGKNKGAIRVFDWETFIESDWEKYGDLKTSMKETWMEEHRDGTLPPINIDDLTECMEIEVLYNDTFKYGVKGKTDTEKREYMFSALSDYFLKGGAISDAADSLIAGTGEHTLIDKENIIKDDGKGGK